MRFIKILAAAILALSILKPLPAAAQTSAATQSKAETSLYTKTFAKPSVKAADKFLKKFPESVYAPEIRHLKDSLQTAEFQKKNVSQITKDEALQKAGECLDAVGWKKDGTEHILALTVLKGAVAPTELTLRILSPNGAPETAKTIPVYTLQDPQKPFRLALPLEVVSPLGPRRNYLHFAYYNGADEYVEVLYLPEEDILHQAMFYGNPVGKDQQHIEGQSPEMMEGLQLTAETAWLVGRLKDNPSLIPISKADYLTDAAIRWWLEKNPGAGSKSARISFGRLDPESSIVQAYNRQSKEKGKNCNAALFDIRGYTVICVRSRTDGEYSLAWCEPVNRSKRLNTIYFETDGTTLVLFYYKGRTTIKYRLSTASHTLRI
ncbi:MAG: hypothetical protein II891_03875 [Bacteroidales bacterium]|nr:hypothetical protein [Bacteroidales bacterium]